MKKVLIAEDDKPIARALELKLKNSGFEVHVTENGQEAMDKAETENYDIILLDLIMPVKDGFSFLEERKEKGINTPVIILSNLSQEGDKEKAKELGAADYFVKSNTPLVNIVENIKKILSE